MRKFISNSLKFTLFASIFYVSSLFVLGGGSVPSVFKPNLNYRIGSFGHLFSRLNEVNTVGDVDILFLGSSHAYRGFDPRIFLEHGYKTFNLGSSSQTPIQTKVLLQRYLSVLNPETIIFEVYPVTLSLDGVESAVDLIANDKNDQLSLKMALEINNLKTYNTLIYGFTREVLGMNNTFTEPIIKGNDTYIFGGFVEKELSFDRPEFFEEQTVLLNEHQLESFSEVVQMIKNQNIELILVYAPITRALYTSYHNTHHFDSIMNGYARYYNFNELISLDDSLHFYDSHHLNQNGVKLFNKALIEVLDKENALK
jgi:hypothetical protein